MRRSLELVVGWAVTTFVLVFMAAVIKPLMIPMFLVWLLVTFAVASDLSRPVFARRRALRELKAAMARPNIGRTIVLPPSPPQVAPVEPSGMILLPPQDRDPRWGYARLQQSGQLHVDRDLRPLTDCPAGHYDYHELRGGGLDRAVRRCSWCPPSAGTWTEGLVGNEDSER